MRKAWPVFLLLALAVQCSAQTSADPPQYEGSLGPASYNGGFILNWDSPNYYTGVSIYGPDRSIAYSNAIRGSEGSFYGVWALDSDGIAARGSAWDGRGKREGRIELLDRAGKPIQTIKTGSYLPQHVVFAPDHTLWTIGYEDNYESRAEDFNVLHHYARNGEEIGQGLPWLQIAGDYKAYTSLQLCLGCNQFFATNERIGFWVHLYEGHETWIETSTEGTLLGKYDLHPSSDLSYGPRAMTAGGSVYAKIFKEEQFNGWAVLDRSKNRWRRVSGYPKGVIIGSDGENIIFSQHDGAWTVLHSVSPESLRVEPLKQETAAVAPHE